MPTLLKKLIGLEKKEIQGDQINLDEGLENILDEEAWLGADYNEGQLLIDVYQTPKDLVIKSTVAGAKPEDIDISLHNDMLTIRGKRETGGEMEENDYLYKECFWGSFSRSIILPVEIDAKKIKAFLENGILTVVLPKKTSEQISIRIKEIE